MTELVYDLVTASDVPEAYAIEISSYPADEAGTLEKFQYRQANAPDLFLGAYVTSNTGRTLIGYVCSTLSPSSHLTHESMSEHVPQSASVCIHSVCVKSTYRRAGVALGLLKEYVSRLERASQSGASYERILLIAHENLRSLYEKAGFEWLGKSEVVHGPEPWYEMRRDLVPPAPAPSTQSMPPGLWEALQRASSRKPPNSRPISAFANGLDDVSQQDAGSDITTNKFDLLCPRQDCGSIILKNGVASLVDRQSIQIEPSGGQGINSILAPLPAPSTLAKWWRITPNAMMFENIGFSRPVLPSHTSSSNTKRLKLLACAECDLGPLGWCEEGGSEFWLAVNRVGYRE